MTLLQMDGGGHVPTKHQTLMQKTGVHFNSQLSLFVDCKPSLKLYQVLLPTSQAEDPNAHIARQATAEK